MINVCNIDIFNTILNQCIIFYEYYIILHDLDPFLYVIITEIAGYYFRQNFSFALCFFWCILPWSACMPIDRTDKNVLIIYTRVLFISET